METQWKKIIKPTKTKWIDKIEDNPIEIRIQDGEIVAQDKNK